MGQAASPELCRWITEQIRAGVSGEKILQAMVESGWDEQVARNAFAQVFQTHQKEEARRAGKPFAESLPEPDLSGQPTVIRALDRDVKVLLTLAHPRIVLFGDLLSHEECDALVAQSRDRLARSETVAVAVDGSEVNTARTSDGMFFERGESELCRRIEARIAALLNWPVENGEGLQVLRYRPGAEYLPHYDYFDPYHASTPAILKRGGQRVGTLVMYLNTPCRGGGTIFPESRLEVTPVKGNAVFFSYGQPDPSTLSLHGGSPVLEGEKWVATKWLRQGLFE